MNEIGLAASAVQQQAPIAQQQQAPITVEEIAQLLKQGITPEELIQNGVPQELVEQAALLVQQEIQAGKAQQPSAQGKGGLAEMYVAQGAV